MRVIGMVATLVGAAIAAVAVIVGIRSAPDIKRYLKMRSDVSAPDTGVST